MVQCLQWGLLTLSSDAVLSLAARIMWRIHKNTGLVSDSQLTTLDLLEDHLSQMSPEDLKELRVDVQKFFQYWPKKSKMLGEDYVAHIIGVVGVAVNHTVLL